MSKILYSSDFSPDTPEGGEDLTTYSVFVRAQAVADLVGMNTNEIVDADGEASLQDGDYVVAEAEAGILKVDEDGNIAEVTSIPKVEVPGYTEDAETKWRTSDDVVNWVPPSDEDTADEGTEAGTPAPDDASGD